MKWRTIAVKLEPDMFDDLEQYINDGDFASLGAAVRYLLAKGLEAAGSPTDSDRVERRNAEAAARRRLHIVLQAALKAYGSADDYEDDADEGASKLLPDYEDEE